MPLTQGDQALIYNGLSEAMGPEPAEKLMSVIIPLPDLSDIATQADLRQFEGRLSGQITGVDRRVTSLDGRVAELERRISSLDERVTSLDERVTSLDERVTSLDERVRSLDVRVSSLDARITEEISKLDAKIEKLDARMDRMAAQMGEQIAQHLARFQTTLITWILGAMCVMLSVMGGLAIYT